MSNKTTGNYGEHIARQYYLKQGYRLLDHNFHARYGELDLIFEKGEKLYFVEVKTRYSRRQGLPYEAVTPLKLRSLLNAIRYYLLVNNLFKRKYSLCVFAIILESHGSVQSCKEYEVLP